MAKHRAKLTPKYQQYLALKQMVAELFGEDVTRFPGCGALGLYNQLGMYQVSAMDSHNNYYHVELGKTIDEAMNKLLALGVK